MFASQGAFAQGGGQGGGASPGGTGTGQDATTTGTPKTNQQGNDTSNGASGQARMKGHHEGASTGHAGAPPAHSAKMSQ
jgi:hypothetical protein